MNARHHHSGILISNPHLMKSHLILIITLLALALDFSHAVVPSLISYQGHVSNGTGTEIGSPTPVNRTVTFRLWNHASATADANRLYAESAVVSINNGDFSVLIGQGTPTGESTVYASLADAGVFNGNEIFLGITVDDGNAGTTDVEISPRQRIVTTAFAFRAKVAESVDSAAISSAMLANNSVTNVQIVNAAVTTDKIGADQITSALIANAAVGTSELADNAVTTVKIGADQVTGAKIADGSVGTADLADGAVTTDKMGADQVTGAKIANGTITSADLASGSVDLAKLVAAVQQSLCPPGTIVAYGGGNAPAGWLLCDGTSVPRTGTYAALFTAIGTSFGTENGASFNVPDFRGRFLRGRDGGAGRDPDRTTRTAMNLGGALGDLVGSVQGHEFKSHSHNYATPGGTDGHPDGGADRGSHGYWYGNTGLGLGGVTGLTGGNETRPVNAYVNYIIKY